MTSYHGDLTHAATDGIHQSHAGEYANAAARLGGTFVLADEGKVYRDLDTDTWHLLTAFGGPTFLPVAGAPIGAALTSGKVWGGVAGVAAEVLVEAMGITDGATAGKLLTSDGAGVLQVANVDNVAVTDGGTAGQILYSDGAGNMAVGQAEDAAITDGAAAGKLLVSDGAGQLDVGDIEDAAAVSVDVSACLRPDGANGVAFSDVAHADLTGVTADLHHAQAHAADHSDGGADEVTVENLATAGAINLVPASDGAGGLTMAAPVPAAHAASHQNGGGDEISVAGLSGLLADGQTPLGHAASHKDGGADELDVEELATAGAVDTVPRSDGAGAVTMVATIAGFDSDATTHAASAGTDHSDVVLNNTYRTRLLNYTQVTAASYTVLVTDNFIGVNRAGVVAVTLPTVAAAGEGFVVTVKDESGNASANTITIDGNGAETVDNAADTTITSDYGALNFFCDGTEWWIW